MISYTQILMEKEQFMFKLDSLKNLNTEEKYKYMVMMLKGQLSSEPDNITNISNASAIVMAVIDDINWAGFYLMKGGELVLGPFQGLPACNRIKVGKGVCGTAVLEKSTQLIQDVHAFPGHIACDCATNSELVIPIIKNDTVYGVLDIDSPLEGRFTELEKKYLENFVDVLNQYIDWTKITEI